MTSKDACLPTHAHYRYWLIAFAGLNLTMFGSIDILHNPYSLSNVLCARVYCHRHSKLPFTYIIYIYIYIYIYIHESLWAVD